MIRMFVYENGYHEYCIGRNNAGKYQAFERRRRSKGKSTMWREIKDYHVLSQEYDTEEEAQANLDRVADEEGWRFVGRFTLQNIEVVRC